jgi:putative ABC transport system substrate-binding protein
MRRRQFIAMLGGTAAFPLAAGAQQQDRIRALGIIIAVGQTAEYVAAVAAFEQALGSLGWKSGDNLRIDIRWSAGDTERARAAAGEILALKPNVILGQSSAVIAALLSMTRTTPVVFLHVADPVANGFVMSLARPEGNVTGITNIEPSIGGKWLQLLKEMAPAVTRVALLVNPDTEPDRGAIFINPFEAAARVMGVMSVTGEVRDLQGIEAVMAGLATSRAVASSSHPTPFLPAIAPRSSTLPSISGWRRSIPTDITSRRVGFSVTVSTTSTFPTSCAIRRPLFCEAQSPPICRSSSLRASRWSSTGRQRKRSA